MYIRSMILNVQSGSSVWEYFQNNHPDSTAFA